MTGTTAIQLCQKGRQICMLQRQWSPQPLYKMMTWAANLHPASKILMETQGIWVQTRQFIISGTVLNIFFSADKNVNKMKSLIFAFVLKAKQEQVHFHLVCGQIGHIQWNAGCCVFGIWLLLPEASKDAVADNAEVYVDGKEHWMLLLVLEQHITVYSLLFWLTTETSTSSRLYPMSSAEEASTVKHPWWRWPGCCWGGSVLCS